MSDSLRAGFKLSPVSELLEQPEPMEWLIEKHLLPDSLSFLIGEPAVGKSFLGIDMACCIATGNDWHGHKVKQGSVAIIAGEGHYGIRRRIKAWEIDCGVELSKSPIAVSDTGASLIDPNGLADVAEAIDKFISDNGQLGLLIIDTLHRNLGPGDENNALDMGQYFNHLDQLRDRYKCTILTVHHTGHGDKDRGRGSSAIRAAVDTEILLRNKQGIIHMSCSKMKDAPKFAPFNFELCKVRLPWIDTYGCNETSAVVHTVVSTTMNSPSLTQSQQYGIDTLKQTILSAEKREVHVDDWRPNFYSGHTVESTGGKKKAFQRARESLVNAGYINVKDDYYSIDDFPLFENELNGTVPGQSGTCPAGDTG